MMVWLLFIIDLMGLFFYTKIGSIISIGDLPTTNIIEPIKQRLCSFILRGTRPLLYFWKVDANLCTKKLSIGYAINWDME